MSVATLNLHWGRSADGSRFDVVKACELLNADVIALQEQTGPPQGPTAAAVIATELGYQKYEIELSDRIDDLGGHWIGSAVPSGGTWGLATLTRLPILEVTSVLLGRARRDPDRRAQVLLLKVDDSAVRIVNTHLTNRVWASLRQLWRLRQLLDSSESIATITLGDLNVPGTVAALVTGCEPTARMPTWPAQRPWLRLDSVLTRGCDVVAESASALHVGSDHRAVRAEVRLRLA